MSHRRGVLRVLFRGDGRLLATGSFDGTARIWDAQTGLALTPPLVHKDTVICVSFSPDGSRLATSSADGTADLGRCHGPASDSALEHEDEVFQVAFSPDGRMVATASKDRTGRLWDAATGSPLFSPIVHDTEVSHVAFHPNGRLLLTACSDNSVAERAAQQWEIATGKPVGPPLKHGDGVLWAIYSPDGTRVATASEDMTARIWDTATGGACHSSRSTPTLDQVRRIQPRRPAIRHVQRRRDRGSGTSRLVNPFPPAFSIRIKRASTR